MSLERVLKLLERLGFSAVDAEVYLYLAKTGAQRSKDLADGLKMTKQQLHPILKTLQGKGVILGSSKRTALFSALPFEQLLNRYVKTNIAQAQIILKNKEELSAIWREMAEANNS